MTHLKGGKDQASGWVELETKVVDQVGPFGGGGKTMTLTMPGKGKKGKGRQVKLRIPASMIPELKRQSFAAFWDTQPLKTPANDATASRYMLFDDISLGTGSANRLGDAIFVEKIVIRLLVHGQVTTTFNTATLAVILDTEPDATAPAWTDMFAGIGAGGTGLYDVAIPEQDKRYRFRYLREVRVPLKWTAAYYTGAAAVVSLEPFLITLDIPIKKRVMYDASVSKPVKGCNVGVFGWSDESGATLPKAYGSYEIFFRDS